MKTIKNVAQMTLLPDDKTAAVMFISASNDGKSAVFMIADTTFEAQGEGHCNAGGSHCRYVTMHPNASGDEEAFVSADGTKEYDVRLLSIHREQISSSQATGQNNSASPKGKSGTPAGKRQAKAAGAVSAKDKAVLDARHFVPALLALSTFAGESK
jgi:hypothetical protein